MANIKFTPKALNDLVEIKAYIAEELGSEISATNTVGKITKKIRMLADFPEIGEPLQSVINIDTAYRFVVCGNYIAFYRYENDEVKIIRVLYGRRNYLQILFGEQEEN